MEEETLRQATENVLHVPWESLEPWLRQTDVMADCSARLWWERHTQDPAEFYRVSLAYCLHQIDRARGSQDEHHWLVHWIKGKRVLDFGSGPGQIGYFLRARGFEVEFADIDTPAFRICREYGRLIGMEPRLFHTLNGHLDNGLPRGAVYDAVIAFDVLEHVRDPDRLVDRLIRRLRPEGALIAIPSFGSSYVDPEGRPCELYDALEHGGTRMRPEHLEENDRFWGQWDELMQEAGIRPIHRDGNIRVYQPCPG